jgi:ActR/RegA family two-component response regulator
VKIDNNSLGRTLCIDKLKFEDLDEVIAMYIEPVCGLARRIQRHRKVFCFYPLLVEGLVFS